MCMKYWNMSTLIPTQTLIYLGGLFHLDKGLIYPTQERIVKLNLAIENLLTQEKASAFMFLHLLGIMASCLQMIPNARLFMRPSFEFLETKFAQLSPCLDETIPPSKLEFGLG
jgi:hypothetical protein